LTLAIIALAIAVGFPALRNGRGWRRLALGCTLGLVLSAFWLTREEGPWILPALAIVLALSLLYAWWLRPLSEGAGIWMWLRFVALPVTTAGTIFALGIVAVCAINYAYYGVFITNEFKSTAFLRAYGALSRIEHDEWRHYVVFPKDARERAYSVSPAARELAPVLEGPLGDAWARGGCETDDCPEILAGWFMWAFRDAVSGAGHYKSAPEVMAYYKWLAGEIDRACDEGKIPCDARRTTMMPVFRRQYIGDTLRDLPAVGRTIFTMGDAKVGPAPSIGTEPELALFQDLVGDIYPAHEDVDAVGTRRRAVILKVARVIAWSYSIVFPPLAAVAAVGLALAVIKIRSRVVPIPLIAMALASLAAIFMRALLLAYIDVTSIPGANRILYASPTSPLVVVFTVLGCWSLSKWATGSIRTQNT
jgi:hypothetical protein